MFGRASGRRQMCSAIFVTNVVYRAIDGCDVINRLR
jgi:hypothetical protein